MPTPGFPHFYYMLGANLGLRLYGKVSVMIIELQCFVLIWYIDPRNAVPTNESHVSKIPKMVVKINT